MMIFDVSQVSEEIGLHVQDSWCSIWTGWKQLQRSSTLISNSCPVMGTGFMEVMRPEPSSSWLPHLNRFDSIFVRVKSQSLGLRCMCTSIHARWPPEEWSIFEPPKKHVSGFSNNRNWWPESSQMQIAIASVVFFNGSNRGTPRTPGKRLPCCSQVWDIGGL